MKRLAATADVLQAHFAKMADKGSGMYNNAEALQGLRNLRKSMDDNITGAGKYFARQMQVNSATETFSKRLADQKVSFAEAIRSRQMFNKVLREQISLQNASAIQWTRSSSGKLNATLYQPEQMAKNMRGARAELGLLNNYLASGSDQLVKWGKNTQWAGRQLMVGFTVPIAIAAAATGKLAYDMDKSLTQITKVYGDVTQGIQESSESIRGQALSTATAVTRMFGQSAEDTLGIQAQLAASGKTGNELQQATVATSRAAVLGELEWQDAVKATISLQEVYHHSAQQVGDDFNYINAMENQTVLTAQDFVTAIPKVAGVMNALGADLKQTGTLLTAFKAAGIDAAEGANALKSINFRLVATYGKGLETFTKMTGRDLRDIINQTNGETIPSLEKFADAIKDLSAPQKIAVTRDVFGIYQGSKALLLLQQMVEKTDQWNQALNVANNSVAQNAAIAQQELDRLNERPFMRIKKAVESMKISLAEAGKVFLEMAAPIIEFFDRVVKGFNELDPATKKLIVFAAGFVALIGPIVMLGGLLGNLIGNFLKFFAMLGGLALRFKIVNAEQRTQELLSRQAARGWDAQTASVSALTLALQKLSNNYRLLNSKKMDKAARQEEKKYSTYLGGLTGSSQYGVDTKPNFYTNPGVERRTDSLGRTYHVDTSSGKTRKISADAYQQSMKQFADNKAAHNAEQLAKAMGRVQMEAIAMNRAFDLSRMSGFIQKTAGAAAGLGTLTLMFGDTTNAAVATTGSILVATGILGSVFPTAIAKAVIAAKAGFATIATSILAALAPHPLLVSKMSGAMSSLLPMLKGLAVGFGVLAVAGAIAWKMITDSMEENRKKMEDYGKSAETLADTLSYAYQKTTNFNFSNQKTKDAANKELTAKFVDTESGKALVEETERQFTGNQAQDIATIWDEAVAQAMKAKMHGATEEQAKTTARVILGAFAQTMDTTDSQFEVRFHDMIDFSSAESQITAAARELRRQFNSAWADEGEGTENWARNFIFGQDDLSAGGGQRIRDAAKENWEILAGGDATDRERIFNEQFSAVNKGLMDHYTTLVNTNNEWLKSQDINSFSDFLRDNWDQDIIEKMGLDPTQLDAMLRQKDAVTTYLDEWVSVSGVTRQNTADYRAYLAVLKQNPNFIQTGPTDAEKFSQRETALNDYIQKMADMGPAYNKMSDAEKLSLLNTYRLKGGLEETGNILDWFGTNASVKAVNGLTDLDDALKQAGYSAEITGDQAKDSFRNVMEGTLDMVQENRESQLDTMWDAYVERIQNEGQAAIDEVEKTSDKAKEKFEDGWDDLLEKEKDKQEAAKDAVEKAFDARIDKIDATIEAEQRAEEIRQRIFEAEENRIKRLSELFNDAIDINVAISTGKFDEAAKLQNDVVAKQAQWSLDDTAANAGDASKKRVDTLQDRKEQIQEEKTAALDALKETQEARNKALEDQKKREQRALDESLQKKKDQVKKEADLDNKRAKNYVEARKKSLELELALIRSYVPKNEGEMRTQIKQIDALYIKYGGTLKTRGEGWAKSVASMLSYQTKIEGNKLSTIVNWAKVGADIANAMIQGAFGMTPKQFGIWLNGGDPPASSPMSGSDYNQRKYNQMMDRLEKNSPGSVIHGGGMVAHGNIDRVGYSGGRKPGEVDTRLLYGEGVLNRGAMAKLGKDGLNALNNGQLDNAFGGMGGGGMLGLGSLPGAMLAPMAVNITRSAIAAAAAKRMNVAPRNDFGMGIDTGITPTESAVNSITSAIGQILGSIGTTGKVMYLGHNGYYDGDANLGQTARPTSGVVTSGFGPRNMLGMTFHNGIDIANRSGTPTRSVASGKVMFSGWDRTGYGNYIQIAHPDGTITGYGHHRRLLVEAGQRVGPGTQIGEMGTTGNSTGNHLHFQTGRDGNWFNPKKLFPGLANGGFTLNDGYAMLHKREAVVPEPLTDKFREGLDAFANMGGSQYNVNITVEGDGDADKIARVVKSTLRDIDKNAGPSRKIGKN